MHIDEIEKNQVDNQRFATSLLADFVYPELTGAYRAARAEILGYGDVNLVSDLNALLRLISQAVDDNLQLEEASEQLDEFSQVEAEWYENLLSVEFGLSLVVPEIYRRLLNSQFMTLKSGQRVSSNNFDAYRKAAISSYKNRLQSVLRSEWSRAKSAGEAVNLTNAVNQMRQLTNGAIRNEMESLYRTATQFYAEQAKREVSKRNKLKGKEYPVITFDSRTSDICISIDSKYRDGWPVGESPIGYPPYHYLCRTIIVFEPTGEDISGLRDADGSNGKEEINAKTPFAKWLKRQDDDFIVQTLGRKRAELFLDGKLELANLTDKYLKPLRLDQLKLKGS